VTFFFPARVAAKNPAGRDTGSADAAAGDLSGGLVAGVGAGEAAGASPVAACRMLSARLGRLPLMRCLFALLPHCQLASNSAIRQWNSIVRSKATRKAV